MKVVTFLLVGDQVELAHVMVESVRRAMPGVQIIQQSDEKTPAVVDDVRRIPWDGLHLMTYRLRHLAEMPEGDMLILDTDVWVQEDVSHIFEAKFDVALTRRDNSIMWRGIDIGKVMPFNTGVMFSRSQKFWQKCHEWCAKAQDDLQDWFGDQMAVKTIAGQGGFKVLELPCDTYNYSPERADEEVGQRAIVHYKGGRKPWMLERWLEKEAV